MRLFSFLKFLLLHLFYQPVVFNRDISKGRRRKEMGKKEEGVPLLRQWGRVSNFVFLVPLLVALHPPFVVGNKSFHSRRRIKKKTWGSVDATRQ